MDEFELQQALLQERRKRFSEQANAPGPQGRMVGNIYARPGILNHIAAGLRNFGAMQGEQQVTQEMSELAQRRQQAMATALRGFGDQMQGQPATAEPGMPPSPPTPPNPMGAYQGLVGSGFKELQTLGMQGVTQQAAEQAKKTEQARQLKLLQGAPDAQTALALGVPPDAVKAYYEAPNLGKTKGVAVNGQLVNPMDGTPIGAAIPKQLDPTDQRKDLLLPDGKGGFMPNAPLIGVKTDLAKAGSTKVTVPVDARNFNTQESEQSKVYGKQLGELRGAITQAGFDAPGKLAQLKRLETLLDGVDGGKAAPALADVASVAQSFGIKLDPKLGVKEAAEAVAREMAGSFRKPGTGPMTDKDFDNFLRQVPDLSKTAAGRKQITQTFRSAIERDQRAAQHAREYARQNGGVIDDNYFDSLSKFYAENPVVSPSLPPTNARGAPFKDPAKESRYQEWLKSQER